MQGGRPEPLALHSARRRPSRPLPHRGAPPRPGTLRYHALVRQARLSSAVPRFGVADASMDRPWWAVVWLLPMVIGISVVAFVIAWVTAGQATHPRTDEALPAATAPSK